MKGLVFIYALFVAHGPAFKTGVKVKAFENIELYNLMADLLGVTPAPNNGTEGTLFDLLTAPPTTPAEEALRTPTLCSDSADADADRGRQEQDCRCSLNASTTPSRRSPLGHPVARADGPVLCVSNRSNAASAYDATMTSPAWLAFAVNVTNGTEFVGPHVACVTRDSWLSPDNALNSSTLAGTGYLPVSLMLGLNDSCDAVMASEVVPMLTEFETGIWREMKQVVADYSVSYGEISVTVGPVYNDEPTALWQGRTNNTRLLRGTFPIPTHFFVVLGRCSSPQQPLPCWESLQLMSFLLPHVARPSNCQSFSEMLRENVARVRDVEIATGLRFFPHLPVSQAARLRTFLPTQVWEGSSEAVKPPKPGHWVDQNCPPKDRADTQCPNDYQPVLMVSLDGFKPQYLGRGLTPVMDRLASCGVHAPYMRSVFPTKTFPNHYSIVTGLYPESHGIIDNNMYDFNISDSRFKIASDIKDNPAWWGGEPIWLTAKRQNVTSATFFWVGSDVPIQGSYPDIFKHYSGAVPFSSRVSTVVEWMQLPAGRRPELMLLYLDQPDHQAHASGPFTPEVDAQAARVDGILGQLMDELYQRDLHHCLNLVVLSDHGFSSVSCDEVVELHDYFNATEAAQLYYYLGPFGRISNTYNSAGVPWDTPPMSVRDVQEHLQCVDHMHVYAKTDLPVRHHYSNNIRIDNVLLDLDVNWTVSDTLNTKYCTGGAHGWDNTYKAMEALFLGYGPAFKNGETVAPFENIELYNMISDLLAVDPAPNNGTEGSLDHLLWEDGVTRERKAAVLYVVHDVMGDDVNVTATCHCTLPADQSLAAISQALNLSAQDASEVSRTALPFGAPLIMTSERDDVTLLYQAHAVTAYSEAGRLPLWVSATVSPDMRRTNQTAMSNCSAEDPRVKTRVCADAVRTGDESSYVSLLPWDFDLGPASALLSSKTPMLSNFSAGLWRHVQSYLGRWSQGYRHINVLAAPAFDNNNDGLADRLVDTQRLNGNVSTHVVLMVARCQNQSAELAQCSAIDTLSFILPQVDTSKQYNCQSLHDYLVDNEARARDVELLTALHLFPALPFRQAVALRTYLPSGLWSL